MEYDDEVLLNPELQRAVRQTQSELQKTQEWLKKSQQISTELKEFTDSLDNKPDPLL